jgi:hypothetical protein
VRCPSFTLDAFPQSTSSQGCGGSNKGSNSGHASQLAGHVERFVGELHWANAQWIGLPQRSLDSIRPGGYPGAEETRSAS